MSKCCCFFTTHSTRKSEIERERERERERVKRSIPNWLKKVTENVLIMTRDERRNELFVQLGYVLIIKFYNDELMRIPLSLLLLMFSLLQANKLRP